MVLARWALEPTLCNARVHVANRLVEQPPAGVVFKVCDAKALRRVPYWKQADSSLYAINVLKDRQELRRHPTVAAALEEWWTTALNSLRSGEPEGHSKTSKQQLLRKEHYLFVWSRVHRELVCRSGYRAAAAAEAEWHVDCRGAAAMGRELFLDAIFELADHWTRNVDVDEYARFLSDLLRRVSFVVDAPLPATVARSAAGTLTGGDGVPPAPLARRYFWRDRRPVPPRSPPPPTLP